MAAVAVRISAVTLLCHACGAHTRLIVPSVFDNLQKPMMAWFESHRMPCVGQVEVVPAHVPDGSAGPAF